MTRSPLEKMGFKAGMSGCVLARPDALATMIALPEVPDRSVELIIAFVTMRADVSARLEQALPYYRRGTRLWFAYPKKSGAIATDISRDHGWEAIASHDMLPVSLVALNDDWSALRFRYRDEIAKLTRKMG